MPEKESCRQSDFILTYPELGCVPVLGERFHGQRLVALSLGAELVELGPEILLLGLKLRQRRQRMGGERSGSPGSRQLAHKLVADRPGSCALHGLIPTVCHGAVCGCAFLCRARRRRSRGWKARRQGYLPLGGGCYDVSRKTECVWFPLADGEKLGLLPLDF